MELVKSDPLISRGLYQVILILSRDS